MITIVADALPAVGLGHVSRCSALAAALDPPVRCLAYEAEAPFERDGVPWEPWAGPLDDLDAPVVVLDGYRFDSARLAARVKLALFHDGGEVPDGVALTIAPIAGGDLEGLEYACLRREFWKRRPHRGGGGILVTTGAGPDGDALAEAVMAGLGGQATLVRGPASRVRAHPGAAVLDAPASLRPALMLADVVIATAGQTSLEAAACGTPAVLVALDAAQADQAATLAAVGAALHVAGAEAAVRAASELMADPERRARLTVAGQFAVDGAGAQRVAERISRLRDAAA
jgi:hypothetical protein